MPRLALPVVLILLLAACDGGEEAAEPTPNPSPQVTSSTSSPTTSAATPSPSSTSPAASAPGRARCTLALGMSVTRDWFELGEFESLPGIEDARWELIWSSGHDLLLFADPDAEPYSLAPISPCAEPPDRVLFQIAAREWGSPTELEDLLGASLENIRAAWPTVEVVELIPIVGGPSAQPCQDVVRPDKTVLASLMNPAMEQVIAGVANGDDVRAGPDLLLADCAQYRDGTGHLAPDGARLVATAIAEHYGA